MTFFAGFLLALGACLAVVGVLRLRAAARARGEALRAAFQAALSGLSGFTAGQCFISPNWSSAIALDEGRRSLCILTRAGGALAFKTEILEAKRLISSEVFEETTTETRTSTSSPHRLGRAALGGALFGGVGALAGGLSGKTTTRSTSTEYMDRLGLRIAVDDLSVPTREVLFSPFVRGAWDADVEEARSRAQHWHGLISVLARENRTKS